jgi:cytochrome c biogenesis protein CcdA
MAGAWTALITLLPIYTWEHHLVFLLLPLTAAGTAAVRGHLRRPEVALLVVGYLCVAWPIEFLAVARESVPGAAWWIQESKFIGTLLIGVMSAVASVRCPRAGDGEK